MNESNNENDFFEKFFNEKHYEVVQPLTPEQKKFRQEIKAVEEENIKVAIDDTKLEKIEVINGNTVLHFSYRANFYYRIFNDKGYLIEEGDDFGYVTTIENNKIVETYKGKYNYIDPNFKFPDWITE